MPFALLALPLLLAAGSLALASDPPRPSAQVAEGERLYAEHCAACHGPDGRRGAGFQTPIWGERTQIRKFETAMGLFEYNQMMMPFDDPSKMSDEEKWAVIAYMLANHGTIGRDAMLDPAQAGSIRIE